MTVLQEVCLILVVLYLLECILAVRRDHVIFWRPGWFRFRMTRARNLPGPLRKGLFLSMPVPPLGPVYTVGVGSVCLSPKGIVNESPHGPGLGEPAQDSRFVPYENMEQIGIDGEWLRINGENYVATGSEATAAHLKGLLSTLKELPDPERAAHIRSDVQRSFSDDEVAGRFDTIQSRTKSLRFTSIVLFVVVFVLFPWMAASYGFKRIWLSTVIVVAWFWIMVIFDFRSAYKEMYPRDKAGRRHGTFVMAMTPLAALRGYCILTRNAFAIYNPLTVFRKMIGGDTFRELAREVYADLYYSCRTDQEEPRESIEAVVWYRSLLSECCREYLLQAGVEPDSLLAPPEKEDETVNGYCPRCHVQFEQNGQECHYCPGITVIPFPDDSSLS